MSDENVFEKAVDEVKTLVHEAEAKIEELVHPSAAVDAPVATASVPTAGAADASAATGVAPVAAASGTTESPIETEVATIETAIKSTPETLLKEMFTELEGIPAMGKSEIQAVVARFKTLYEKL